MASRASSMNVTTGSGTPDWGSVLGVNSGRGSGFVVLGICHHNTTGSTAVPGSAGAGIAADRGLTPVARPSRASRKAEANGLMIPSCEINRVVWYTGRSERSDAEDSGRRSRQRPAAACVGSRSSDDDRSGHHRAVNDTIVLIGAGRGELDLIGAAVAGNDRAARKAR